MREVQEEYQQCTHSIATKLHHTLEQEESVRDKVCTALEDISRECVQHLTSCLEAEDLEMMSRSHVDQITQYFTKLVGDRMEGEISLENCQERDYQGEQASTQSDEVDVQIRKDEFQTGNIGASDRESVSEMKDEEKNTKVPQENADFEKSFSPGHNVNFLLLLYSLIKILLLQ